MARVLNLFYAMGPYESLVKPTDPFSEKCIEMHTIVVVKSTELTNISGV